MRTINDIARQCGVSKSTVSRVLNGHPYVSEQKRQKVLSAIEESGFTPNNLAVQFRKRKTSAIGIITPQVDHPYFASLVQSLSNACAAKGWKPVIFQTFGDKKRELDVFAKLKHRELDGIIATSSALDAPLLTHCLENGPILICNEKYEIDTTVCSLDEEHAAYKLTMHMLQTGKKRLLFCLDQISPSQEARYKGFLKALAEKNVQEGAQRIEEMVTIEDGIRLGNELFRDDQSLIDGIFAGSDFIAAGILHAAKQHGISVPEKCAVTGFDNHPISQITDPPLTTYDNDIAAMAQETVEQLDLQLTGNTYAPKRLLWKGYLVPRNSA
ncbi:LacI family DNA-binding transcriptional regulator [Terribacillus sp. FSL K6-0262]|uniref:LacI family DNA-binding transcriptional regulator n=1 Tax=Terribacillus sp. FSL K6-0262 TaxID=2921447 RepID=UPI0030EBD411